MPSLLSFPRVGCTPPALFVSRYTSIQSTLDAKDDEINRLQIAKAQQQQEMDGLRRGLEDAKMARQRAEVEASSATASYGATMEAMKAMGLEGEGKDGGGEGKGGDGAGGGGGIFLTQDAAMDSTLAVIEEMTSRQKEETVQLKGQFEDQIKQLQERQQTDLTEQKGRADQATEEWNTIEYELKDEREVRV